MKFYIFKSDATQGLRAFSGDQGGQNLPEQFRPWHAIGVVRPDAAPPHNFKRDAIETAIAGGGYQLWRLKTDKKH
jgi:hypothetical protein